VLNLVEVVFGPILPARIVHEVSRTEELAERRLRRARGRRAPCVVRTYRLRPRGKTRCTVELRVVVAAVLAVAADVLLVAQHLLKFGAIWLPH
jgi:hypothetical protein